jgi:hypothetical protein
MKDGVGDDLVQSFSRILNIKKARFPEALEFFNDFLRFCDGIVN